MDVHGRVRPMHVHFAGHTIMPIDFVTIYEKIKEIGAGARERKKTLEQRRLKARALLGQFATELESLRSQVEAAKAIDPSVRCALPIREALNVSSPIHGLELDATLIAADGSQINPDRHGAVQFCLINVGAIMMRLNSGEAPEISTDSELLYGDELIPNGIPMSEAMVALRRDLRERAKLDELSKKIQGNVVGFTDGPLELWGAKGEDAAAYAESVQKYLNVLSRLQTRGMITAGYVDKPGADLVVRLLELATASSVQLGELRTYHPLRGVTDRWLFGEKDRPLLLPGHRSAVFGLQSGSETKYTGALSLHFFYLNVGSEGHPHPVRVEIPKWVADDPDKLNLLHAVLISQCQMMGSRPYPYLLHRAHETAVVRQEEKYQIEQMLTQELRKRDEEVDEGSYKQSAKDLKSRTRMKA